MLKINIAVLVQNIVSYSLKDSFISCNSVFSIMPFNITPDDKKYFKHYLYLNLSRQTSRNCSEDPMWLGLVLITLFH